MKYLIILHLLISAHYILQWWYTQTLPLIMKLQDTPPMLSALHEGIGICMSKTEAEAIIWLRKNVPEDEHILWNTGKQVDPIVNWGIFPRRIYHGITNNDDLSKRNIKWVVERFDHGKVEVKKL